MTPATAAAVTLSEYTRRISEAVGASPALQNVWVTAETSDVRRSGHCYLELIEKNPATGEPVARLRATIWRTTFGRLDAEFFAATGRRLESGIKVRVLVSASFHSAYGLSANITAIDPSYTLGDLMRLRMEILNRLKNEGILEQNRSLTWPVYPENIAVISAPGAAGYGDFMHQLLTSPRRLRFNVRLFPATVQGATAPGSIISALEAVASDPDTEWDCVVLIRGGGATSDLAAFENYDLAAAIAMFPLPVVIGIGHERDITVLDYVANMRVKTPTAAAEWLIARGNHLLEHLDMLSETLVRTASQLVAQSREQLAYMAATLPYAPGNVLARAKSACDRHAMALATAGNVALTRERSSLQAMTQTIRTAALQQTDRASRALDSAGQLLEVLSPASTLRRGYSVTRLGGKAVSSVADLRAGDVIETTLADGTVVSVLR